jgi:YD repeat-containing protein
MGFAGRSYSLTYDAENPASYIYDGVGQRVGRVLPSGATTTYVYDAFGRLAAEYSSSVLPERPGGPITSYLSGDQLGSIRLVTDSSGNVVAA